MPESYEEFLDQIAEGISEFKDLYGFEHNCRCRQDWEEENVGLVSECYTKLCDDALEQCFKLKGQVADKDRKLDILRVQVSELGGEARV